MQKGRKKNYTLNYFLKISLIHEINFIDKFPLFIEWAL